MTNAQKFREVRDSMRSVGLDIFRLGGKILIQTKVQQVEVDDLRASEIYLAGYNAGRESKL